MLIDIHAHTTRTHNLTRPNGSRYPNPPELVAALDAHGIDKAVTLSTVSPECRYSFVTPEEVSGICAEYPERLIPFFNHDPRMLLNTDKSDFHPLLNTYVDMGFKGVGENQDLQVVTLGLVRSSLNILPSTILLSYPSEK